MNKNKDAFFFGKQTPRETVGDGLIRQIFGYNDAIIVAAMSSATLVGFTPSLRQ